MVLQTLEFSDCLLDSPHFRERLNAHEKELDNTNKVIKKLIQEGKELISAAKNYAKCQRAFAQTLVDFKFETIGSQQTDEEITISKSLRSFGETIRSIEDARDTMMEKIKETFVDKLEEFRKGHLVPAKDERKKFEKTTKQYCAAIEKHLALKPAKSAEGQLQESDTTIEAEKRVFHREAMTYVKTLQEVQDRKKFEFVEILLAFMYGWKTFYHQGHETGEEMQPYMMELGQKLSKTRDNFESTRSEVTQLMTKMLEKSAEEVSSTGNKMFTRQGYLYTMEKKALGTISWNKYFCSYQKEAKIFTMIPFHQTTSNPGKLNLTPDTMVLDSCTRKATDAIDRRFCFDIAIKDRPSLMTLQALSDEDRRHWLEAMDGKEPVYFQPVINKDSQEYSIDEVGFAFVHKCIDAVETRGITDQGLYRVVGVSSKVSRLMQQGIDAKRIDKLNLSDPASEFEVKTITSSLKNYFRNLSEPLMTYRLHHKLISAAKLEDKEKRVEEIGQVVQSLPPDNYRLAKLITGHLKNVAAESSQNKMSVSNLAVCFGPTLLRPEEETVAAIMDIKFNNLVIELLIENFDKIFSQAPPVTNGVSNDSPKLRLEQNKVAAVAKHFSEDNTYGKHRPSYRASSVYANVPNSINPTQTMPPSKPEQSVAPAYRTTGGMVTRAIDNRLVSPESGRPISFDPKLHNATRQDLYASKSQPVGRLASNYPPSSTPVKKPGYSNNPIYANTGFRNHSNVATCASDTNPSRGGMSKSYGGGVTGAARSSNPPMSSVPGPGASMMERRVRTLYACDAENDSELSFEPNEIIYNVRESREPGWLEGTLRGKTGLLPANYIEYLN